ncbi:esterase/lipase family protein [Aerolutibacter ruishenii]|uniref:PGAP1-like protein n=1 Tax=Aerolutibacter ruishenii TaxID=686800 RepID=A0A562LKR4_9GAMM|nr:alpha/beta fold hydrolase [Lysobacter ruishenii]TWI08201.1 PGAP1-like protein [Lysobacter ruishenii]
MKVRHARPLVLVVASLLLSGCAALREFRPAVEVAAMTPGEYITLKRGDILTSGKLSAATLDTIRVAGLDDDGACAKPEAAGCIQALSNIQGLSNEQRLSALSELWLQQAQTLPGAEQNAAPAAGDLRQDAWMEVARHAYAYLFFSERTPAERAFEDRQTQVRDYYNLAVQEAASRLFASDHGKAAAGAAGEFRDGLWVVKLDQPAVGAASGQSREALPQELLPASSLSFAGLRRTFRRDGFGAELVAVKGVDPVTMTAADVDTNAPGPERPKLRQQWQPGPAWSEMPATAITALLRFSGENLAQLMSTHEAVLSVHDPFREAKIDLHGRDVPLAGNFTAGYGLWLARSGFNRQSLYSLFGREQGIDHPHLYLMRPYDPDRRIIVMIHGLASSPEAWVNMANELNGDEEIRSRFQIWQFYYPTNMPIALNHHVIRQTLDEALRHFDPQGRAVASRDVVLIGHSMGGVISRLMVSSSGGDALFNQFLAGRRLDDRRRERLRVRVGPLMHFEPVPQVERAIFLAAPHRGTDVAGGRLGRFVGGLVRLPLTLLEGFADVLDDLAHGDAAQPGRKRRPPNSIDNLDRANPFIRAVAELPISPCVRYHSIIGHLDPEVPLARSDDGLVPYWSAHLDGAISEKVIRSAHSVQETAPAIIEIRRILREDISRQGDAPTSVAGCRG